jgi:UDP-N-acetyl-2-amino-2-deoxyglucuronate dehydrogenase
VINIGLLGCGRIAKSHVAAIQHHANALKLSAVCDIDPQALQADFIPEEATRYTSYIDMLEDDTLDLIVICTPSGLHPEQTILAAENGKHVVTEKPMATTWEDGIKMVNACEQAGTRLFVVKQNRNNPTVRAIKEAIDQGYFGKIYMVASNVFWTRPQDYYDQAAWRGTWELDGGALMNQASHYIDLLAWLVGDVESVQAMIGTLARNIEAEDTAVLNLRWANGALGSMSVTMLTYPKNLEGSITILGEKGSVRLGGVALNEITQWEFKDHPLSLQDVQKYNYEPTSVYGKGHIGYYENIIKVLNGEAGAQTDGHEGLRSLELLIAAYRSAEQAQSVTLPIKTRVA